MTEAISSLLEVADSYDAIVLDQWGVLHDGGKPYPGAVECLRALAQAGHRLAVLSNSGKRSAPNVERMADMGFPGELFEAVMTGGEALWRDAAARKITESSFFAIERAAGDATAWGAGLDVAFASSPDDAQAVLLMGLPDGGGADEWRASLNRARERGLKLYCSNPDIASPRAGGLTLSPGALALEYRNEGGQAVFYGKPYRAAFDALRAALGASRLLMVGDSLDHDIAGARQAGWDSVLVRGGLHSAKFEAGEASEADSILGALLAEKDCPAPTYSIGILS